MTASLAHRHCSPSQIFAEGCLREWLPISPLFVEPREHFGHLLTGWLSSPWGAPPEEECVDTSDAVPAVSLKNRPRQQHEIPPKSWLDTTANSKTIFKVNVDIVAHKE